MKAISQTYRKRGYPPWNQPKAQTKDKTALELSAVLVRECWTLFESVWQVRNGILHSKDSIGASARNAHLTEQLLQYKYNADTMLQYGDRNQIDYVTSCRDPVPDASAKEWSAEVAQSVAQAVPCRATVGN